MDSTVEEKIILALNAVYMRSCEWSFAELEAGFQAVERQFAGGLEDADYLEVKRRVAEGILTAAEMTEQPVERCRDLLDSVERLGWSSLYGKSHLLAAFSRYCLDHGRKDVGLQLLVPLIAELEQDRAYPGDKGCVARLDALRTLLAELQA
jgi:hypothetical protein